MNPTLTENLSFNPGLPKSFALTCDAPNVKIDAVLHRIKDAKDNRERVISCDKPPLPLSFSIEHFRPYIYSWTFTIYTDHRPVQ